MVSLINTENEALIMEGEVKAAFVLSCLHVSLVCFVGLYETNIVSNATLMRNMSLTYIMFKFKLKYLN